MSTCTQTAQPASPRLYILHGYTPQPHTRPPQPPIPHQAIAQLFRLARRRHTFLGWLRFRFAYTFASPQVAARGLLRDVEHPVLGPLRQVGPPFELHGTPASVRTAPPLLGEQSDEILAELGYTAAEVATLRGDGVI